MTLAASPSDTVCCGGSIERVARTGAGGSPSAIVTVTVALPIVTPGGRSSAVIVNEKVSSPSSSQSPEVGMVRTISVLPAVIVSRWAKTAW